MPQLMMEVYSDLLGYMDINGSPMDSYKDWYCGIAGDVNKRLQEHNVSKEDIYSYGECFNDTDARRVEKIFLELGCDGGDGGGNEDSVFVYVYLKNEHTNP